MLRTTIQLRMLGDEVSLAGEQAALGLTSTISDLAKLGESILTSAVLPAATTRRWLKPFASASILPNAVGRPWEIDYYRASPADAIIDVYTKSGTVGKYSSYFGLVPSYDVGFAILAVDNGREAPDLDAYADITLGALLQTDELARAQASGTIAGTYTAETNSTLVIGPATADPGLAIVQLKGNGTDWLAHIAEQAAIDPASGIDFRL
ncbi:hypothetical protein MBLNU13_g00940t1 [Cladosporium sp. NU13]